LVLRKELGWRTQFGGYMNLDFFYDNDLKGNAETLCLCNNSRLQHRKVGVTESRD
jgi:hypothetical protein